MANIFAFAAAAAPLLSCKSDLECSLNGVCTSGACVCVKPWGGASCGVLQYATTPRSGHSVSESDDMQYMSP